MPTRRSSSRAISRRSSFDPRRPAGRGCALARTSAGPSRRCERRRRPSSSSTGAATFEVRPTGNAVSLEDEMLKVAANQMDYQAATALYTRGLGLIKTALGKR